MEDLTYCEHCLINMEDDFFDFRFEYPICLNCAPMYEILLEWVSQRRVGLTSPQAGPYICGGRL